MCMKNSPTFSTNYESVVEFSTNLFWANEILLQSNILNACTNVTNKSISTGSSCIDNWLDGGIAPETITLIYGEPETGKTTLAMQCVVNSAMQNIKTVYVDCDNTFATERLLQITGMKFNEIAEQIILIRPKNFDEQTAVIDKLQGHIRTFNAGLVVIDTLNGLYRAKVAEVAVKSKAQFQLSRELNRQLAILAQTAKTNHIPIIITSQVKSMINEPFITIAPVATRVLQFWANTTIALKATENPQTILASIKKDQNAKEATCYLRIAQKGIIDNE